MGSRRVRSIRRLMIGVALTTGAFGTTVVTVRAAPSPPRSTLANALPQTFVIPPNALPDDVPQALALLTRRRDEAPRGSRTRADLDYVIGLADRFLRPGQPKGRQHTIGAAVRVNAWWYATRTTPQSRAIARLPDGVLATYWEGHGFSINPVATTGRWRGLNDDVSANDLAVALLPFGVARRWGKITFSLWEYYDVADKPRAIRPGASGMAQGRIATLMARVYHRTGDPQFADAAAAALNALKVTVKHGGVVSMVADPPGVPKMPWYVERAFPGENPWKGAALNGFMVSLINIHTASVLLRKMPLGPEGAPARAPGAIAAGRFALKMATAGDETLRHYLPTHDTGSWSLYGLLTPRHPWKSFRASPGYHCYHVRLLRDLERIVPKSGFGKWADKWAGYAKRANVRCGAPVTNAFGDAFAAEALLPVDEWTPDRLQSRRAVTSKKS